MLQPHERNKVSQVLPRVETGTRAQEFDRMDLHVLSRPEHGEQWVIV